MDFQAGSKIKNYTLKHILGRGAAGEVWLASVDGVGDVAIKFMNAALLGSAKAAKHMERMEREIQALQHLKHPNIPALQDYDLTHNPPYLTMSYVGDDDHDKLLSTGKMLNFPLESRLQMLTSIADALTTAHESGIVHRDIKPSNIIGIEQPYLIDFSLAIGGDAVMRTMAEVGTTLYMPPESNIPDLLSDAYSFAVVTYEILFGGHPVFAAHDDMKGNPIYLRFLAGDRIMKGDWRKPSRIALEDLPLDLRASNLLMLDEIFMKAMGARENRYTDQRQFIHDVCAAITIIPNVLNSATPQNMPQGSATQLETQLDPEIPQRRVYLEPEKPATGTFQAPERPQGDSFTMLEVEREKAEAQSADEATDETQDENNKKNLLSRVFPFRRKK